jgi:hypothetical protein
MTFRIPISPAGKSAAARVREESKVGASTVGFSESERARLTEHLPCSGRGPCNPLALLV